MKKISTKDLVLNGVMIALVFLATFFTRIPGPVPPGYINFGDTVIMITAIILGKYSGMVVGAFGSALADIVAGGFIFAPITFLVKGLEGYLVGRIAHGGKTRVIDEGIKGQKKEKGRKEEEVRKIVAIMVGALVMVAGYFLAEFLILSLIDTTFGFGAAVLELPFNLIQGGVSAVLAYTLSFLLKKVQL